MLVCKKKNEVQIKASQTQSQIMKTEQTLQLIVEENHGGQRQAGEGRHPGTGVGATR